ncbi:hydroxyphenylacetyl-CoA thioesterase PaaI [Nocardiopsis sp. EMB25]|uniref:hydroxyphenylacetyl-CoA thioesterase PaaI n=1 Tax=Nocardiopsis sp. EMB25 TaxID=2835867 RepID=UPI002284D70D|nr:hydroxyphenylacetyl-CoA thioesterase PaaI [Nocardiopsis sp. EMB25]MCY9784023.1 hydroxyphenylacetyl-CoA thioesterase PaaI [Nocardiopsis sp. EMB25]
MSGVQEGLGTDGGNETARRMFEADQASKNLGMRLVAAGPGTATVEMAVGPLMVNGHGIAHGGFVFTLADTAFACACNRDGRGVTVASGADITFVAPVHEGDVLVATAVERTAYGRSSVVDVTVRRGEDVIAEFRGRSRTLNGG